MSDDNETGAIATFSILFLVMVILGICIYGCNVNEDQTHRFELQKMMIERQCPDLKAEK